MSQAQEAPARATEDGPQRDMPATAVDVPETADQTPVDDAALDLEAAPSLTRELTREQVELETRGDMRDYATGIVMAVATVNMGCMLILQPMHPMMCSNARGATRPGGWDPAYTHPQAFPASGYPSAFSYTWAVSTILVVNFLGAAISEVTMGTLSDRYGRKPALLVGTGLGACTLVGYYVAGVVLQSYWAYLAFQFVNGLSGGIKTVVQSYIQDVNEPSQFTKLQFVLMTCVLGGGVVGPLFGDAVSEAAHVDVISGNLFLAALFGAALLAICFLLVLFTVPEPPRQAKFKAKGSGEMPVQTPRMVRRILMVILVASGFDAFGDQGTVYARNVIFSNRYPTGKSPSMITLLMTLKLAGVFIAMVLVFGTKKKVSRATWCLVGNLASAVCQYALAPNALPSAAFIVIWTAAQLFGYTSTMAAMQLVPQLAPAETRGFWVGLLNSTGRGAMAVAPLVLSVIYARLQPDDGVSHDPTEYAAAEMACLVACGTVSVVAFLLYLPLRVMMPRPPTASLEEEEEMERYLRMSPKEWSKLPMDLRWSVNAKLHEEGRDMLVARWSDFDYAEDLRTGDLVYLHDRSQATFRSIRHRMTRVLCDRGLLAQHHGVVEAQRQKILAHCDLEAERAAFARWTTSYFEDAGYYTWLQWPDVYKTMIMNAFPPLDDLSRYSTDRDRVRYETMEAYETRLFRLLAHLDRHEQMYKHNTSVFGGRELSVMTSSQLLP